MSTKTVLIGGYYGANNLGDEAILQALIRALKERSARIIVASFQPEHTARFYDVQAVHWRNVPSLAQAVMQSNLVVIGGGGLFMDYWGVDPATYFRPDHAGITTYGTLALLAQAWGVPYALVGVGVGPLFTENGREETRRILQHATHIIFRDSESQETALSLGVSGPHSVATDLAFALEPSPQERRQVQWLLSRLGLGVRQRPLLCISLRYWDRPSLPREWVPRLAQGLRLFLRKHPFEILLVPFQVDLEGKVTNDREVLSLLARHLFPYHPLWWSHSLSPLQTLALMGHCDLVIGMRLHSLIFAFSQATPALAVEYDPKVRRLATRAAMQQWVLPLSATPQAFAEALEDLWHRREEATSTLRLFAESQRGLAQQALEFVSQQLLSLSSEPTVATLSPYTLGWLTQIHELAQERMQIKEQLNRCATEKLALEGEVRWLRHLIKEIQASRAYKVMSLVGRVRRAARALWGKR